MPRPPLFVRLRQHAERDVLQRAVGDDEQPRRFGERDERLQDQFAELAKRGLTSVLVEGGADVHGQFLARGLWDELRLFIAPKVFGRQELSWAGLDERRDFQLRSVARIGDDVLLTLRAKKPR